MDKNSQLAETLNMIDALKERMEHLGYQNAENNNLKTLKEHIRNTLAERLVAEFMAKQQIAPVQELKVEKLRRKDPDYDAGRNVWE